MSAQVPDNVRKQVEAIRERIARCEVVRDFPWSHVLRLTTSSERVLWAKRCGDGMAFEPALTAIIEEVGSPLLVPSLWIDGRWIGSEHVEGRLQRAGGGLFDALLRLQRPLAALQRALAPRVADAAAVGTPSLGSGDTEALLERTLAACARDQHLAARPLTLAEAKRVRTAVPRLRTMMEMLESANDIRTIQHLDLHHGNLFDPAGGVRIFDWGNARIGSPLLQLVSTVSLLAFVAGIDSCDRRVQEVRDAYLAAWPELEVDDAQRDALHDPRLAALVRLDALTAAIQTGTDEQLAPFADWLPELARAVSSPDRAGARGVRLA